MRHTDYTECNCDDVVSQELLLLLLLYGAIPYPHSDKPDTDHDTDYENNDHYSAHHDTAYVARMRYLFFVQKRYNSANVYTNWDFRPLAIGGGECCHTIENIVAGEIWSKTMTMIMAV